MKLILGSKSPRRRELIEKLGIPVDICSLDVEEIYPPDMEPQKVPAYLAELKSKGYTQPLDEEILVTSDTIVVQKGKVIEKPENFEAAFRMLRGLSDDVHQVFTSVCLRGKDKMEVFTCETQVEFFPLSDSEINHYIEQDQPYDKAGSYGIQEWIGYIGIKQIQGDYYNVMGLPLSELYQRLKKW